MAGPLSGLAREAEGEEMRAIRTPGEWVFVIILAPIAAYALYTLAMYGWSIIQFVGAAIQWSFGQ